MRLKPGVLQWAAVACFCVGLIYALGLEDRQQRSRYGKINRTHARNTEYPALPEHSSRRDA